ncbi:hypothetical protein JTE90_017759 [Oedothorax gibbosus]|uniref:Protein AATF n=1 Tax=Oedothorax gibbosus TaxID=931172 RepID=A0AAV6UL63_9ARAC|nr:hypothetical protein JTE90_017759 [Oedothorax gibbosus]
MVSLGEKIAKLTNPTPEVLDPEDDINYEAAKTFYTEDVKDADDNEVSDLRRRTAPLLEDIDPTYSGKKVSRQTLGPIFRKDDEIDFPKSAGSNGGDSLSDSDEAEDDVSDSDLQNFKEFVAQQSNESDADQSEEDESLSEEEDEEGDMTEQFSNFDVNSEIEKGQAIKNQKEIWNRLMESRIKLQKLLVIANKLPQASTWNTVKDKGGKEMSDSLNKASKSIKNLMSDWVNLQSDLVSRIKEMSSASSNENPSAVDDSEEIPSDTDDEMEEITPENKPEEICQKRKLNMEDFDTILGKRFKSLEPYRNAVIQKWDEKTRLATGRMTQKSFQCFDNSALKQIEQILQDKTRLVRRTQLKRSLYRVLGKPESIEMNKEGNAEAEPSVSQQDLLLKDYDPEIFDDDDFYRQILKDVIESKSFGIDPAVVRKQMEIQKIRNKMKRKVDTKASKGRKLRYDVHPKLVNFMAPVQISTIADEARDSFLKHLFGGKSAV